ncbi:DNA packaging protein B [Pseudomonas phage gh-1]|uniref:Terminase, large subunit n=7 Tax=Ghunavirus TaxID=2732683 RepID=A0A1W6JRZ4_9CAUD|nr:terminase large subunit [Pseudomonas phage gh-1]YP_009043274.1 terminase large subunit [Pseudomonas phage phiPSA2]YP_009784792.1 terminase large subunit [Pseudomonas phage phiPsa17]YP_009790484.1 terminase large subunit [Pseudomonas phage WRT]QHB48010.1 DNA packaging protein B [Pseudomonas phage CHF19]QHB48058.1 DNA packaging protein B [Pseudomonas phage CHF21]QHB48154.1 DNA packaging protein B [Pseudomonas phage CHF17]URA07106.1 large terminase subunit [Xanthomonas phage Laurelin]WPH613
MSKPRNGADDLELIKRSFVAFLFVLWRALNLPKPTKCQIDMAKKLSAGDERRFILQAFRGIGKSFITCAFVVWKLWNNPDLKFMIVSASKERADANSVFIKRIIDLLPFLHELKPGPGQRDSSLAFDVGPAKPDHSPSVKSVGITGQLTGSRADILIADDVEVPNNSATQTARDHLGELVKEFDAILKPGGTIIYLGTPQTEMTLYRELEGRGYVTTIWPARYPKDQADWDSYGPRLAPMLAAELQADGSLFWAPTDEVRFDDKDLRERELSYGKGGFALQFMLNPNLSDMEKYPLKLRDFIVGTFAQDKGPTTLIWMPNAANECKGVPVVGLKGDRFHRYESVGQATASYAQKILVIDPSGRGKDETGYAVLYQLNGYIFLMDAGGFRGGYEDTVLQALANIAKIHKVNEIVVEGNFGDGMYIKLLAPVVTATFPCAITEVKSKGQKELRICDVLEPVLGSHKLVIQESLIEKDYRTALNADGTTDTSYSLLYQLTRITRERGSLAHDDRLDALAIGVQFFTEALERDSKVGESEMLQEFLESHMEDALMGHDRLLEMSISEGVSIQYEDDGSMSNYMGWR